MALWTNEVNPFGQNRTPGLIGLASDGSGAVVPVAVDKTTGAILTETGTSLDNVNLIQVGGLPISLGQTTMSASIPVTIASDQNNPLDVVQVNNSQTSGNDTSTTAPGTQLVSLAGPTGDALDTFGDSLKTYSQLTDGQGNTANIINSNAPGNNSLLASPATSSAIPWSVSSVTTTPGYYVGNYKWVSVQIKTFYVGSTPTITFQGSNDNINWVSVDLANTIASVVPAISTTGTGIFHGPLNFMYFRLSFTGTYTSGTSTGIIAFSSLPGAFSTVSVSTTSGLQVAGLKTNNAGTPSSTNLGVLPAVANANNPLYTETFQVLPSVDLAGNTRITSTLPLQMNSQQIAGTDISLATDGIPFMALTGPTGDPIDTTGNALNVNSSLSSGNNPSLRVNITPNNELYSAPGVYQAAPPGNYVDGQRIPLLTDNYGQLKVVPVGTGNENLAQVGGNTVTTFGNGTQGVGVSGAGSNTQIKDDSAYGAGVTSGILSVHARSWNGTSYDRQGALMPGNTALNTYSIHLTTNTTTTPTAATAYISSIAISNEVAGTTSSITIQDKQGTPLKLVNGIATTALTTAPTIISFNTPVKMVSGIDIITAGAVAATVDVWINYYQ
jgi:hypothetical protein